MDMNLNLHRGLDLRLKGAVPPAATAKNVTAKKIAVYPTDFPGFTPKLDVKTGDTVAVGASLMHDKTFPDMILASPVSGTVTDIVRGERRKIIRVEVTCDAGHEEMTPTIIDTGNAGDVMQALLHSGLWIFMRQRPYDIVPVPGENPVNIFITAFDSSPLAPSLTAQVAGRDAEINAGIKALKTLTDGNVYVSMRPDETIAVPAEAEKVIVTGAHPAGNPGVQAASIAPVNKGQTIWTLDIVTVSRIGALMLHGTTYWDTTVAVTGADVTAPCLINTVTGADLKQLLDGNISDTGLHHRIISGNVLTGIQSDPDGYLHFPYRQITVIAEGDDVDEFMGWASLSPDKMSTSRSFLSWLMPRRKYAPDARLLGGRRAMIMSEVYDKVLPMDIIPEYLIKAILSRDIDRMEALGIYEVAPEDFALCEYVDPSKLELQKIVREGLDYLRKELA